MANGTVRLGRTESKRVAAALETCLKSPARSGRTGRRQKQAREVGTGEVLVAVLSSEGAIVERREVRGHPIDLRELRLRLIGAGEAVDLLAGDPPSVAPALTAAESALLDEAGLPRARADTPGALERTRIALELMLRDSLSLEEAAKALGVRTTSRIRQRLVARTLFGIKDGRSWRVPRFQFRRGKLVRGIGVVLPHVRADAHPVAVKQWFTTPQPDLAEGDDERPASPLDWLDAGNPPERLAELAEEV